MSLKRVLTATVAASAAFALAACSPSNEKDSTASSSATTSAADSTAAEQATEAVDLNVLAASSTRVLEDDFTEDALTLELPANLTFDFDGSSGLVSKMEEGAPADLFISADKRNMDKAVEKGLVLDPVNVATNSMVMVVPKGNPAGITGVDESLNGAKLVLCAPQVPCGGVSQKIQEDLGVSLQPVSEEQKVGDVLTKVVSGEADAGWVYRTDAAAAGDDVEIIEIPNADQHPNELWAAVAANSENKEAADGVLRLIASNAFSPVWEKYGFSAVSTNEVAPTTTAAKN